MSNAVRNTVTHSVSNAVLNNVQNQNQNQTVVKAVRGSSVAKKSSIVTAVSSPLATTPAPSHRSPHGDPRPTRRRDDKRMNCAGIGGLR